MGQFFAIFKGRNDYETAPYKVMHQDGDYEVREYPPLNIIETYQYD